MPMPRLPAWFRPDRWVPPPGYAAGCNITRLLRASGANDYDELHRRSVAEPSGSTRPPSAISAWVGSSRSRRSWTGPSIRARQVVPWRGDEPGVALRHRHSRADGPAVLWEAEDGATLTMSRRELAETVRRRLPGWDRQACGSGTLSPWSCQ